MGRKQKILESLEIIDIADKGKGLGRYNDQVVFVDGAIPGEVVTVRVTKKRRNYLEARVIEKLEESPYSTDPFCSHFYDCGGCKWQHFEYQKQVSFKENSVHRAFEKIGKIEPEEWLPVIPAAETEFYRNRLDFAFSSNRWLTEDEIKSEEDLDRNAAGFHVRGRFDRVLDIEKCWLQDDKNNDIRKAVKRFAFENDYSFYDEKNHTGNIRSLLVRNNLDGEWMVMLMLGSENREIAGNICEYLQSQFPEISSLWYVINTKKNDTFYDLDPVLHHGNDYLEERLGNIKLRFGPKSFMQTNTKQALTLYEVALNFADLSKEDTLLDLYCGVGSIGLYAASDVKNLIGIESVPEAIEWCVKNSELNGFTNTQFYNTTTEQLLNGNFDIPECNKIIVDPPRAGLHPDAIRYLLNCNPEKLVYVSCNPSTQARDLELLKEKYKLIKAQPVDMFPHTHHIENVALLELK